MGYYAQTTDVNAILQRPRSGFMEEGMINILVDVASLLCLVAWAGCFVLATGLVLLILGTLGLALIRASAALLAHHR